MPDEKRLAGAKRELQQDPLVEFLKPSPSDPTPRAVELRGYVGKHDHPGFWRLYLTSNLDVYVAIADEDIINSESLATEQDPLAGTRLWVRRSARLQYTRIESSHVQAEFLQGGITEDYLRMSAVNGTIGSPGGPPPIIYKSVLCSHFCPPISEYFCPSTVCPTIFGPACGHRP